MPRSSFAASPSPPLILMPRKPLHSSSANLFRRYQARHARVFAGLAASPFDAALTFLELDFG
jgi:hypothetical protein